MPATAEQPGPAKSAKDLFLAATNLPADQRQVWLEDECRGDADLLRRVEVLLAAHDAPGSLVDRVLPAAGDEETRTHASFSADAGTVISGRYKLLQQIGEGGMGAVWMADQTEPVKRRVAVKLIRVERGQSKTILSRFEAERQAIAMMDHPNIAKLLDAGTTEEGSPFFIMELVKGVPLTEYCDAHRLSVPGRLHLFMQVCSAVQHAHQKGVIHRDLKPTNILVEDHDGKPVPKVIDFGLAKATTGLQLTDRTLFTAFGSVMGTPTYMAPEQANFNAVDIDTRADVYALGVILYELLTGTTPLTRDTIKKAHLDEMLRLIREQEPPTPSSRLSTADSAPSVAANRQMEPAKLNGFVRGELDWIVMKALSKERDRRYETAVGFAKDVERFLNQEPVAAGPPSTGYRLKKFAQRNRGRVVAGGMVLLALVAGVAGTTVGLVRADAARRDAEAARRDAEAAAEREAGERTKAVAAKVEAEAREADAKAVVTFFETRVFRAAGPKGQEGGLGKDVTLRNAIEASLPALEGGFTNQPHVEAVLRYVLGTTFHNLGEHDKALEQNEKALALSSRHWGADHSNTLRCMNNLANTYKSLNRREDALKLHEAVVAARKRVLPPNHPDTLKAMGNLARTYFALGRHDDAVKLKEEVLATMKHLLPPDHPETLAAMNSLAASYTVLDRRKEALKLHEEALAGQRRVLPKDHPDTLASLHNLAIGYFDLNRREEGLKLHEEALAAQRRVLPKDHSTLLNTIQHLGLIYAMMDNHAEAVKLYEEALSAQRRVLPAGHPDALRTAHNLAVSFSTLGRHEDAVKLNEESLAVWRRTPDAPDALKCMHSLAIDYAALNRHAEALKLREEVLAARKRVMPRDHPSTIVSMWGTAESLIALGRGAEAVPLLDECVAKAAGRAVPPTLIPGVMALRRKHFETIGDAAGCRATAEMWEKLTRTDPVSLYEAACFRSVTAGVQSRSKGANATRLKTDDADKAMVWLEKAVAAGFKDTAHMKKDADLEVLRGRQDFKKLLTELESKSAQTKNAAEAQKTAK